DEPDVHDDHGHGHHAPKIEEVHEAPLVMLVPLGVLALGAVFAGIAFDRFFIGPDALGFWHGALGRVATGEGHELPLWVELAPIVLTILGFLVAWFFYIRHPERPKQLAAN